MARIPESEVERLKREVSVQRLAEARGIKLQAAWGGPAGAVPVPRRPQPVAGHHSGKNLWHCLGACDAGRHGDRLGDAGQWNQLPPCGRVAASGPSSLSRRSDPASKARHGAETAASGCAGRRTTGCC